MVLAGGDGTRLQGLTQAITGRPIPKQYCRLVGGRSLLEMTLSRVRKLADAAHTLVIVNRDHLALARDQFGDVPATNVLVQPCNLDTGPGVLFGLLQLAQRNPEARVSVFPSDHYIGNESEFLGFVERARQFVALRPDSLVLLGIRPEHPETGYGYIAPGGPVPAAGSSDFLQVAAFYEKPAVDRAHSLTRAGALWNSFVFAGTVKQILGLVELELPEAFARMSALSQDDPAGMARIYHGIEPWNFSRDFLAKVSRHLVVLPAERVEWSDWGTPELIARTLQSAQNGPALNLLQAALRGLMPTVWPPAMGSPVPIAGH